MTKKYKFWTAAVAFLPLLFMIAFTIQMFSFMFDAMRMENQDINLDDSGWLIGIGVSGVLLAITGLGSFIYYLLLVINRKSLDSNERVVWIIMLFFIGVFVPPVFWYMKIYKADSLNNNSGNTAS